MNTLRCACLVSIQDHKLLLVRVRENQHWYLPGGKIETHESPAQALQRELMEELGIVLNPESIRYLYTVQGPAYGQDGEVKLLCFTAEWTNQPQALQEISEVAWLDWQDSSKLAPAVQILCRQFLDR